MWIVLPRLGFFSAVAHRDRPGVLLIRARDPDHLVELKKEHLDLLHDAVIETTPVADYLARLELSATSWSEILRREASAIDYDNVKSTASRRWGHAVPFLAALHECWGSLRKMQQRVARPLRSPGRESPGNL